MASLLGVPATTRVTHLSFHLCLKLVKNTTSERGWVGGDGSDVIALGLAPPTTLMPSLGPKPGWGDRLILVFCPDFDNCDANKWKLELNK